MTSIIHSFDVFDTCIIRNFAKPTDLFYSLYNQGNTTCNSNNYKEISSELAYYRVQIEANSRSYHKNQEDISIDIFYRYLDRLNNWKLETQSLLALETEIELNSVKPILATKKRIEQLRNSNIKIIFISDMYLPSKVIQKMLLMYHIAEENDSIYVSGDIGLTKRTGSLFKYVLDREKIKPHQLHHYGDNLYSDVIIPRNLGIKATHFKESKLNRYEKNTITLSQALPQVKSQIAGVSRAARLMCADGIKISQELASLATNVIAPLLVSYVAWVVEDAQKNNIEKLYFVSRDGQILHKIAQELSQYISVPECHYLYGSRQAWFLPSVFEVNRHHLSWLIRTNQSVVLRHLLKKLQIEPNEIEDWLSQYKLDGQLLDKELDKSEIERFWQLIENPDVTNLISQKAKKARETALQYFKQEGLCSDNSWAIVDIGWRLTCQKSLKQIIQQSGYDNDVKGYYFGVYQDRLTTTQVGNYRAFLIQDGVIGKKNGSADCILKEVAVIEEIFTRANHRSVIGYQEKNGKILPIFRSGRDNFQDLDFIETIHEIVLKYADEIGKTGLLNNHLDEFKRCAVNNAIKFFSNPSSSDVRPIAQRLTSDDQNESRLRPLVRPINLKDFMYVTARFLRLTNSRDYAKSYDWREGSIAISHPIIRFFYWLFKALKEYIHNHQPIWIYQIKFALTKK